MSQVATETLRGIPEIRRFFRTQPTRTNSPRQSSPLSRRQISIDPGLRRYCRSQRGGIVRKACTVCHSWRRLWPKTSACAAMRGSTTESMPGEGVQNSTSTIKPARSQPAPIVPAQSHRLSANRDRIFGW